MATTYTVSSSSELLSALSKVASGDTILLEAGSYGTLDLSNMNFTSYVTLRSADPENEAMLTSVNVNNSSYIRLDDLHVSNTSNGASASKVVGITNSNHIEVVNSEINGLVDNDYTGHYGLYAKDSSYITFDNNYVHDVNNGVVVFGVTELNISENLVDYIGSDFFKFGGIDNVLIENNTGGGHLYPLADTHADFMQFQGATSDAIIRGNVFLAQTSERAQGIFLAGTAAHTNILIEDNIIYSGKVNAIFVNDLSSGITVRDNTLLNTPDLGHHAAAIRVPSGSIVENNITSGTSGGTYGSNIIAQYDDVNDVYHYNTLFVNADAGLGITLEDLTPIVGSLAETKGAYDRLMELLDGASDSGSLVIIAPTPAPTPEPTPEPTSDNTDDAQVTTLAGTAYAHLGALEITGKADVIEVAPTSALALASGTIALTFNADTVSGSRGILSRDASYYTGGGNHFATYIKDGSLYVRFQDGAADKIFTVSGIKADTDYDLQVSFGDGNVSVLLDGQLVGTAAFNMSWESNVEYMQIGANGWGSDSGATGFGDVFDGTISDVVIVAGVKSPAEMAAITNGETTVISEPVVLAEPTPIYSLAGDHEFLGASSDIVTVAHDPGMETQEGSFAFSFEADDVKKLAGLISKDASDYEGGGNHFSVWIKGGKLNVRFQDADSDATFTVRGIKANTEYDVVTTFDDDEVSLYLNGNLVGTKDFTVDLAQNHQYMQIGGLGWASDSGSSDSSNPFDGTISNVMFFDEALTPQDFNFFA
jgi:hypothetical protein